MVQLDQLPLVIPKLYMIESNHAILNFEDDQAIFSKLNKNPMIGLQHHETKVLAPIWDQYI